MGSGSTYSVVAITIGVEVVAVVVEEILLTVVVLVANSDVVALSVVAC